MTPIHFPEANCKFVAPPDLTESQVMTISAYRGKTFGGSVDGSPIVIVAWQPSPEERELLYEGAPVFLTMMMDGGLPPHFLTTNFQQACNPA